MEGSWDEEALKGGVTTWELDRFARGPAIEVTLGGEVRLARDRRLEERVVKPFW
jgi:hypothetical protein